jgi:hypothetical protein
MNSVIDWSDFRKSTYSQDGNNSSCVEVAFAATDTGQLVAGIRDSKNTNQQPPVLSFPQDNLNRFLIGAAKGTLRPAQA